MQTIRGCSDQPCHPILTGHNRQLMSLLGRNTLSKSRLSRCPMRRGSRLCRGSRAIILDDRHSRAASNSDSGRIRRSISVTSWASSGTYRKPACVAKGPAPGIRVWTEAKAEQFGATPRIARAQRGGAIQTRTRICRTTLITRRPKDRYIAELASARILLRR